MMELVEDLVGRLDVLQLELGTLLREIGGLVRLKTIIL